MTVRHVTHTLPSGLRVVAVPLPATHRVVLSAHLSVGPRYERDADNGISHFLEHMLYRGTPRHPSAHAQALAFERLGGTLVAITGVETGTMAIGIPLYFVSRRRRDAVSSRMLRSGETDRRS